MTEYEIIKSIVKEFRQSPEQWNALFACDAEIISVGDQLWGMTIDDFTPEEDLFTSDDPETLGWNLATATLSDLLAAGVAPKFFMQAISLPVNIGPQFIKALARGIRSVLDQAQCALCGGDLGTAETWRFCGFAMGPVAAEKPITRILPATPQELWVTGELGDANLAALQKTLTPRFELRMAEAMLIRQYASACIDTSGGFMDSLWLLQDQNANIRLEINAESLPLAPGSFELPKLFGIPGEAALFGGAGEYELLFAVPQDLHDTIRSKLLNLGITHVGYAHPHEEPGIFIRKNNTTIVKMEVPPPCPREVDNIKKHIQEASQAAQRLFGC